MCRTIIITTTEQAEAVLKHLEVCCENAKKDDFASEKAKKVKNLLPVVPSTTAGKVS